MKSIIQKLRGKKMITRIVSVVIGGILGFAYYKFVGCRSGSCPLTSNPYISTIWGSLIGFMITG